MHHLPGFQITCPLRYYIILPHFISLSYLTETHFLNPQGYKASSYLDWSYSENVENFGCFSLGPSSKIHPFKIYTFRLCEKGQQVNEPIQFKVDETQGIVCMFQVPDINKSMALTGLLI